MERSVDVLLSADARTWTRVHVGQLEDKWDGISTIAATPAGIVVAGQHFEASDESSHPIGWFSKEGLAWEPARFFGLPGPPGEAAPNGILATSDGLIAHGNGDPLSAALWLSDDGAVWVQVTPLPVPNQVDAFARSGEAVIVAGYARDFGTLEILARDACLVTRRSAGILLYRRTGRGLEVLLGHPGGPYFTKKDAGSWSIPKGEPDDGEDDLFAIACREFAEETGHAVPDRAPLDLGSIVQKGGKVVFAWAIEGDLDPAAARSNDFEMVWPPGSGEIHAFPEIDRVAWFDPVEAKARVKASQIPLIERLEAALPPS